MSTPRALKCPSCGASPELDAASGRPFPCEYCGTQIVVSSTGDAGQAADDDEIADRGRDGD
jgi:hypothetical protein